MTVPTTERSGSSVVGARGPFNGTATAPPVPPPERRAPTIATYLESFTGTPAWTEWAGWPPDVFALTNLLLDYTDAYRFVVAPPLDTTWPPTPGWSAEVAALAREWRDSIGVADGLIPGDVRNLWSQLVRRRSVTLTDVRHGHDPTLWTALVTLHAVADEACRGLATRRRSVVGGLEREAWDLLARHGSLSTINPSRVKVTPKTHLPQGGITIRSLSRYLALTYESVELGWHRVKVVRRPGSHDRRSLVIVLLPWPLHVSSDAFRPVAGPLENMDEGVFGFFEFDPGSRLDIAAMTATIEEAIRREGSVDVLVFPEAALTIADAEAVEGVLSELGVGVLVAGLREPASGARLGRNLARIAVRTDEGWVRFDQDKHHRWCLDGPQIRQYRLSHRLRPERRWWEAIGLPPRTIEVIDLDGGTFAPLICEDLARLDEVSDLLRRIGPSLVVGLLLDGPQLADRWAGRYAAALADDPGSAVLTLTSLGMARRSHAPGLGRSRVVAMWADRATGRREIALAPGASGIVLRVGVEHSTSWTADGRRHEDTTPAISLSRVQQHSTRTKPTDQEG